MESNNRLSGTKAGRDCERQAIDRRDDATQPQGVSGWGGGERQNRRAGMDGGSKETSRMTELGQVSPPGKFGNRTRRLWRLQQAVPAVECQLCPQTK